MPRNGTGSKTAHRAKVGKARAKGKERKVEMETEKGNPYAIIGAKATAIVAMLQPATSLTMVLKEASKEKGKEQHRYRRKPLRKQRKKSWQW